MKREISPTYAYTLRLVHIKASLFVTWSSDPDILVSQISLIRLVPLIYQIIILSFIRFEKKIPIDDSPLLNVYTSAYTRDNGALVR